VILNFRKRILLCVIFSLTFCFVVEAEAQKGAPTLADKREIIKVLLETTFRDKGFDSKTIYVSKQNLPTALQKNFPQIKDVSIKLVAGKAKNSNLCPYEFGKFSATGRYVTFSFGNCNEALGYNFKKIRGKWRLVPLVISK
jgi:hypothetical protein